MYHPLYHHSHRFPIDSSAILFLSQFKPDHTNVYRFTAALSEPVEPELLQQAVNRICQRYPTIFAGFHPTKHTYTQAPSPLPPQVRPDPGFLLVMSREELENCAYRLYYSNNLVIIELFHGLTDGYGALTTLKSLLGEYLLLKNGVSLPERQPLLEAQPDWEEEHQDAYLEHSGNKTGFLPRQHAYQLPYSEPSRSPRLSAEQFSTPALRAAARQHGVSVTSLLGTLMAEAIMEVQLERCGRDKQKPVRIMVPIDLRHHFPSKTLRNFILYALPTLAPGERSLSRPQRLRAFQDQLRSHSAKDLLQAQITRNTRLQEHPVFLALPLGLKCAITRLSNRFFGETNSSITLTNLGPVPMSDGLKEYVSWIRADLMPRVCSPYNCAILSCGDVTTISITRFGSRDLLEARFFQKLRDIL